VIGAAVFREAVGQEPRGLPPPVAEPLASGERAGDAAKAERRATPASAAAEARSDAYRSTPASPLGTAHGERRWSPTWRTPFERASRHAEEVIVLRYDHREALVARGVIRFEGEPWWAREPRAFPGSFVPDP